MVLGGIMSFRIERQYVTTMAAIGAAEVLRSDLISRIDLQWLVGNMKLI